MQITIRTFDGKSIELQVESTDTILNVKEQIQKKESIRIDLQRLVFANESLLNNRTLASYSINNNSVLHLIMKSNENTNIIAGGYGQGNELNQLNYPYGLCVDKDEQLLYIADWGNHRIIQWKIGENQGQIIFGHTGQGNQLNQLSSPTDLVFDKQTNCLFICDRGNRRVLKFSLQNQVNQAEIFVENISCWGITMDNERSIYISDTDKHLVLKYKNGETNGTIVAGGHGRGSRLNQLDQPAYLCVDEQQSIFISDVRNNRVVKWIKDANQGILITKGSARGLYVDSSQIIYIADYSNHRLIKFDKESNDPIQISIRDQQSNDFNQVYYPWGISSDQQEYLFVTDHFNHRVQRFAVK